MENLKCKSVLNKSVYGAFSYLAAVVFTIIAISFSSIIVIQNSYLSLEHYLLIGFIILNMLALWGVPLSHKTSLIIFSEVIKIMLVITASIMMLFSFSLLISNIILGNTQNITSYFGEYGKIIETFNLGGLIGVSAASAFIFAYECLSVAFICALKKTYKGKRTFIRGRFLSVFSFTFSVIFIIFIPIRVFFNEIALALGIDTSVFSLGNIHFDFEQYALEDGFNLTLLVLLPLFYFLIGVVTKSYADNKPELDNAINGGFKQTDFGYTANSDFRQGADVTVPPYSPISNAASQPYYSPVTVSEDIPISQQVQETPSVENTVESNDMTENSFLQNDFSVQAEITEQISENDSKESVSGENNNDAHSEVKAFHTDEVKSDEIPDMPVEETKEAEDTSSSTNNSQTQVTDNIPIIIPPATSNDTADSINTKSKDNSQNNTANAPQQNRANQRLNNGAAKKASNKNKIKNKPKLIAGTSLYDFGYSENSII